MTNKEVQKALISRGFDVGPKGADGDIGQHTIRALGQFQKSVGLPSHGIADEATIKALGGVVAKKPVPDQPGWLTLASAEIGTVEGIGKSNNPKVVKYFADAGFAGVKEDATAWCAAFVGAMLKRAGVLPSGSLAARSYEGWGVALKAPVLGCIATKKRAGSSWQGHVGIVVGASKDSIILLGGNQGDRVSIASFKRSEFTSFRWPSDLPIPTDTKLPTTVAGAKSGVSEA